MADNDTDLVSNVAVTGVPESTAQLKTFGDVGAAAFEKVGAAAAGAGAVVAAAGKDVSAGGAEMAAAAPKANAATKALDALQKATEHVATEMKHAVKDVVEFGARTAKLGAFALAAVTGIAVLARSVAKQADTTTDSLKQQTDAQQTAIERSGQLASSQIQFESTQRSLQTQLQKGQITWEQYAQQVRDTRDAFNEQMRVQRQLDAVQEETKRRTDELQKQAANTEAYHKLIDTFGGPLTSSLIRFGTQVEQTRRTMTDAFSPGLASLIDAIGGALQRNSGAIEGFAARASLALQQFVAKNGPAIDKAVAGVTEIVSFLVESFAKAGPAVLGLINEVVVPAFQGVRAVLTEVSDIINKVFGTQINAAFLLALIGILKVTRAFRALFATIALIQGSVVFIRALTVALTLTGEAAGFATVAVRLLSLAFGPWGIAIALLVAGLALLAAQIDWPAFAATVGKAIDDMKAFFVNLANQANQVAQNIEGYFGRLVDFFTGLPAQITQFFSDLWDGVVALAQAAVDTVVGAWTATVAFFKNIATQIQDAFNAAWNFIVETFNGVVASITSKIQSLVATATSYLQPLIDLLNTALKLSQAVAGDTAAAPQGFARGGHVGPGAVRGPGSSTSDSIWARLSRGEFVVKASRVAELGVGFMNALNAGAAGLADLPRFAMGGLVGLGSVPVPAFASSVPVSGGADQGGGSLRPFALHIGADVFNGLLAPEHVAQKLTLYATRKNTNAAGRTSGWKR